HLLKERPISRPVTILGAGHKMRPVAIADLLIGHVPNVSEAVYEIMRVITKQARPSGLSLCYHQNVRNHRVTARREDRTSKHDTAPPRPMPLQAPCIRL